MFAANNELYRESENMGFVPYNFDLEYTEDELNSG
jgi:hypothetical protein